MQHRRCARGDAELMAARALSPELESFRAEVREFLRSELQVETAERVRAGYYLSRPELFDWQQRLHKRGWAGMNWPVEWGGTGWSPMQKYIFEDECARAGAPILIMMGLNQVASLLMGFGTEVQKQRFLPRILDGSELWCQGFSEPQSGSDLASLRCPAVRDGDEYVVNGSKIWTTAAHWAEWCLLLVRTRTTGKRQEGITILLLDMKTPGITVRPIISLDGMHSLNELFLDNVRIPVAMRIGEEDQGWPMMKVLLGHERLSAAGIWKCRAHFDRLSAIARQVKRDGVTLIEHPRFRARLAWLSIRIRAMEEILLAIINLPGSTAGIDSAMLKIRGTEVQQELLEMMSEAAGYYALPFHPDVLREGWTEEPVGPAFAAPVTPFYFFWRKSSISGGANEIMRNSIALALLG